MTYAKLDKNDGMYYVYDTDCSGVLSGPYATLAAAQKYCDEVNA